MLQSPNFTYNIIRYAISFQVLDVLVLCIDDFSEFFPVNFFFVDPHFNFFMEDVVVVLRVGSNNSSNN